MSISGALSNALSGLTATSRMAELVSSNISNAMTDGYGRRELAVSPRLIGDYGGVTIDGVTRHMNMGIVTDRRFAQSDFSNSSRELDFLSRLETIVGTPEDDFSLSARMAQFESDLVSAASRPDVNERLEAVLRSASALTETMNGVSDNIQRMRTEADHNIATQVDQLNQTLQQVRDLNIRISTSLNQGKDPSALQDHRQVLIDQISEIVPVREVPRDRGTVALFTPGGAILLDGLAATVEFQTTNMIMPHMTVESGDLSGLSVNGIPIRTDSTMGPMRGGTLGALFEVRDEIANVAQGQVDAVARDVIERFQDSGIDPTLATGSAGLFTDDGAFFNAADEVGLAGRMSVNALVNPDSGGAVWKLRDGIGAAVPGAVGDGALLSSMVNVMSEARAPASGGFGPTMRSAAELGASFLSRVGSARELVEQQTTFASTQLSELKAQELEEGVDTDHEMQRLMLIEQAYAANARMMQAVDAMMQTLLEL